RGGERRARSEAHRLDANVVDAQKQRARQRRPALMNQGVRAAAVTLVEQQIDLGKQAPVVLKVKALVRPRSRRFVDARTRRLWIALREPRHVREADALRGRRVEVAALLGFAQQDGHAMRELTELTQEKQRPNMKQTRVDELPLHAHALVEQELLGALAG